MSVSCDVDIDLLDGCFELGPYHGLRKQSDDDTWEERTASGVVLMPYIVCIRDASWNTIALLY